MSALPLSNGGLLMILIDAIASVDNLVPNTFDETEKRRWLRDFDHLIYKFQTPLSPKCIVPNFI